MNQTEKPIEPGGRVSDGNDALMDKGDGSQLTEPGTRGVATSRRPRVALLVAASVVCLLGLAMLAGGGWGLWKDRVDRDGGFVTIGTTELHTETYAIISDLRGDGPGWLYGSRVLGDARVRASSRSDDPIFIGIAPKSDVSRYLDGVGYATIGHLATGELSSTRAGRAPSLPPARALSWAASTEGPGEQTLVWKRGAGDWSIVLMNSDGSEGVAIRGDLGAKFPPLPWVASGLLIAGAILAVVGGWLTIREIQRGTRPERSGQLAGLGAPDAVSREKAR